MEVSKCVAVLGKPTCMVQHMAPEPVQHMVPELEPEYSKVLEPVLGKRVQVEHSTVLEQALVPEHSMVLEQELELEHSKELGQEQELVHSKELGQEQELVHSKELEQEQELVQEHSMELALEPEHSMELGQLFCNSQASNRRILALERNIGEHAVLKEGRSKAFSQHSIGLLKDQQSRPLMKRKQLRMTRLPSIPDFDSWFPRS